MSRLWYFSIVALGCLSGFFLGRQTHQPLSKASSPHAVKEQHTAKPSSSYDRQIRRIERRMNRLETRISQIESNRQNLDTADAQEMVPSRQPQSAPSVGSPGFPTMKVHTQQIIETLLEEDNSPLRKQMAAIVSDEFDNRRSEWRAMRQARAEARDDELLDTLQTDFELSTETRAHLQKLLNQERDEARAVRFRAREDYDFKSARKARRDIQKQTDRKVEELLDAASFDKWLKLREARRPPWRR